MKPYFESKHCTLYHGDCLEIMPELSKCDLLLTDPPYGIGYVHAGTGGNLARSCAFGGVKIIGDDKPFDPTPFLSFENIVLFGANHYADKLPPSSGWLIWDKRDGVCSNNQSDCEMAWTNRSMPARLIRHLWNGMLKDSERGIIRVHPTQKPIAVMEWCMAFFPKAQTILDPFMGSGTTGVACCKTNRQFTGIELDERYVEVAANRIERAEIDAAQNLFLEPEPVIPEKQMEMVL